MLHRWFAYSSIVACAWLAVASCKGAAQTLCMPGENIFCKCVGGNEGTKTCQPDGQSFDVCVDDSGDDCSTNPATTDVTTGPGSSTSTSSGAGGAMTNLPLFTACSSDGECKSGECKNEYCTLDCGNFHDCKDGNITGDCVRFDNDTLQICAPYCMLQTDCTTQYGPTSACGGASALDDPSISFAVCGDWGAALGPIPAGTDCTDTPSCSLGLVGYEEVCIAMKCAKGCLVQSDCPTNKSCPSDGTTPSMCQ